ncbi:DUF5641 domain-containing protein [Trichonephila inaurata madagascariensis]|uniref:DUF5641 domain-containing protein n=1 Tax=Trichonephila inaurata madagascariensis TaxID=2747483 RepID=A0A8X6XW95_9ARAC|nr:DUF5641 domain-containing protein [Trichonephila inaurata madagascariensis]
MVGQWLRLPAKDWTNPETQINREVLKEKRKGVTSVNISSSETVWYLTQFSKYSGILRLVAWILRFDYNKDPDDLTPPTPSMFLQDIQAVGVPDLDNIDNINLTKRLRYRQRLRNYIRNRFRDEYLSLLVHQEINKTGPKEVRIGEVVLIDCDNRKRLDWPGSRGVLEKDNSVRIVKVKTHMGELIRPVK